MAIIQLFFFSLPIKKEGVVPKQVEKTHMGLTTLSGNHVNLDDPLKLLLLE